MKHEIAIVNAIEEYGRIADITATSIQVFLLAHDEIVERLINADSTFASAYVYSVNWNFVVYALKHRAYCVL